MTAIDVGTGETMSDRIRVALVHNILPPYRVPLFNEIAADCELHVVLARLNHGRRRKWDVDRGRLAAPLHVLKTLSLQSRVQSIDISFGVSSLLDRIRPDVVVVAGWDLIASWSALRWARQRGVPTIAWVETSESTGRHRGALSERVRRKFLQSVDCAVVPGKLARAFVERHRTDIPIFAMPNPIAADELRQLPRPEAGAALFLGELSPRKGFDLIAQCATDLAGMYPDGLIIAGTGPMRTEAERLAAAHQQVEYLGFVDGPSRAQAFARSSVLLLPSRRDPWPLVAAEALAAGRAVVLGPGVGSLPDLLEMEPLGTCGMREATLEELQRCAQTACRLTPSPGARAMFTPRESSDAFMQAIRVVAPGASE